MGHHSKRCPNIFLLYEYPYLISCDDIRAILIEQIRQRKISFPESLCVELQNPFAYGFLAFEQGFEIVSTVLFYDVHVSEELCEVFCIIDDGIAWTLCSGDVLHQDVLV